MIKPRIIDASREGHGLDKYDLDSEVKLKFVPITEITYNPKNAFGSYMCELINDKDEDDIETFNVVGNFINSLNINQTYEAVGIIKEYRGNKQLEIKNIKKVIPNEKKGIIAFLHSLREMGPLADIIYDEYGDKSLDIIKNKPLSLLGLSPVIYKELVLEWQKEIENFSDDSDYMIKLINLGLKPSQAKSLFDKYGEEIFFKLKENPYILFNEGNYSFKKCDDIAKNIGIDPENMSRLTAGIYSQFSSLKFSGDTYFNENSLIRQSQKELSVKIGIMELKRIYKKLDGTEPYKYKYGNIIFKIDQQRIFESLSRYKNSRSIKDRENSKIVVYEISEEKIKEAIHVLELEGKIIKENDRIYRKEDYENEEQIAAGIGSIIRSAKELNIDADKIINDYCSNKKIILEEKQKEAIKKCISKSGGIIIIDGSAGCGKTFCIKAVLDILTKIYGQNNFEKVIVAPTGKASKVAQKATGIPSYTVHRLLGYNPEKGYAFNGQNKLPYDCIVVDESSMLDTELAAHLIAAIGNKTKVIMVGDIKQLPPIGSGNVLKDLINCKKIDNVTLDVVKRQGKDSGIIINARNIIDGKMITSQREKMDALIYRSNSPEDTQKKMLKIYLRLEKIYGKNEVQVLTPQKTGPCGTNYLNFLIQEEVNQLEEKVRFLNKGFYVNINGKEIKFDLYFKKGDRVINTKNDYKVPWYINRKGKLVLDQEHFGVTNGEIGTIVKLIQKEDDFGNRTDIMFVKFDDKYIIYRDNFSDLDHAYALTIHKSQGSEWKSVILILTSANRIMLNRNLLYTGYTRAKDFIAMITPESYLKYCINNQENIKRNTGLPEKLEKYI